MDDTGRVSILAYPGPGHTPNELIALVAKFSGAGRSALSALTPEKHLLSSRERMMPPEMRYGERQ